MNYLAALQRATAQPPWTGMVNNSTLALNGHVSSSANGWRSDEALTDEPRTDEPYNYDDYYNETLDSSVFSCDYGSSGASFLPVLYSLFFVVGFLGNILVIWVVAMGVKLRSMTDICLLNLAIADLLLVSSLPFLAHYARDQWIFGDFMCTMVLSVYHVGFYGGIFFIVLMSVDRYLAVVHAVFALRVRTKRFGILASLVIWIIAVSASFPELIYLKTTMLNNQNYCTHYPTDDQTFYHSSRIIGIFKMNVIGLILPLIVIGVCYSLILSRLLTARSSRRQAMRLVIAVMVVFFCCWAPYNVASFMKALELKGFIPHSCDISKAISLSLQITEVLAYSHSCLNPILYVFVGEKFSKHFLLKLLCNVDERSVTV